MNAGRKRSFDKDEALDKAMRVFWENGYAGTSLADLTSELGINKPSLYSAFGNKEKLFESSLNHYMTHYAQSQLQSLDNSSDASFKERLKNYLYDLIESHTNTKTPKGCFFVKSSCEAGSVAFPVEMSALLKEMNVMTQEMIYKMLEVERKAGQLPNDVPLEVMTNILITTMYGLAVQARSGKDKKTLLQVANYAVDKFTI